MQYCKKFPGNIFTVDSDYIFFSSIYINSLYFYIIFFYVDKYFFVFVDI